MANTSNPIAQMYQHQLEASRRFADVVFSSTEKIDRVFIEATHRAFNEQVNYVQAIAGARDPQSMVSAQAAFLSRRPDSAVNYQKEIIRIFSEIQTEMGKSMQEYFQRFGKEVISNVSTPLKAVQEQAKNTNVNPVTGMFSVWESAMKEATSLANRNMNSAQSNFEKAANATQSVAQQAVDQTSRAVDVTASKVAEASQEAAKASNGHRRPRARKSASSTSSASAARQKKSASRSSASRRKQ